MAKTTAKAKVAPTSPATPVVEEPVVVQKQQGPFINGSRDIAFDGAIRWATDNNVANPQVSVGHNRDSNQHEAWVVYETTE